MVLTLSSALAAPAGAARTPTSAAPLSTPATPGAPTQAATPGNEPKRWTVPLARLVGDDRPVRLAGTSDEFRLSLPLPALWQAEDIKLELTGTASLALVGSSQLEVQVNGRVVGQRALNGQQGDFRFEVAVPPTLLRAGFNEVQLRVAQHYTDRCEYPLAAELWTQIDLTQSRFLINASRTAVPLRLDQLDALFDKANLGDTPLVPVLSASTPSPDVLSAMGLAAQGIGLRYDYVPARLTSGRWPTDPAALGAALPAGARGAVLLGTLAELSPYLAGLKIPADSGPLVAVRPLPGDATRFALLLAAPTEAELPLAAAAFALQRMPWPDAPWVSVRSLKMPVTRGGSEGDSTLLPSTRAAPLSALRYRTTTYTGQRSQGASLKFWNGSWQGRLQVRLHMSYASGMAPQSALNVLANGVLHGSIPLSNTAGGLYENYAVSVPAGALKPGWNTLELQPVLVPLPSGGDCKPFFPGNLAVTVYEDSTVQSFGGSLLNRPDLALLAVEGRPTPAAPVGVGMSVLLTDADDTTVGAGLTLTGKLAQVFSGSMLPAVLKVGDDPKAGNRIWVGATDRLPDAVRAAAGIDEAGLLLHAAVPVSRSVQVPVLEGGETLGRLRDALEGHPVLPEDDTARVSLSQAEFQHVVAATVLMDALPLTVFTAPTSAGVLAGLHDIVDYGRWGQLRGGMAQWRPGDAAFRTIDESDAPFTAYSLRGGLGLWVSQYPWVALGLLLLLMVTLVGLTRVVLSAYRRRHMPTQAAVDPLEAGK